MRIEAYNQVAEAYQSSKVSPVKKAEKKKGLDAFEISQKGKTYQTAMRAVREASDIREDKVAQIKSALASGTYNVSGEEFAERVVERIFDQLA